MVLLAIVLAAIGGVWNAYEKERESAVLRTEAEVQLQDLDKRQTQLKSDIANLQTDRGREEVLREQYALAAQGEGLIVIVEPQATTPTPQPSSVMQWVRKFLPFW